MYELPQERPWETVDAVAAEPGPFVYQRIDIRIGDPLRCGPVIRIAVNLAGLAGDLAQPLRVQTIQFDDGLADAPVAISKRRGIHAVRQCLVTRQTVTGVREQLLGSGADNEAAAHAVLARFINQGTQRLVRLV